MNSFLAAFITNEDDLEEFLSYTTLESIAAPVLESGLGGIQQQLAKNFDMVKAVAWLIVWLIDWWICMSLRESTLYTLYTTFNNGCYTMHYDSVV